MAAGDFSAAALLDIQQAATSIWGDQQRIKNYTPKINALLALRQEQTASFKVLADADKDHTVKVYWNDATGLTATDLSGDECAITGTEAEAKSKSYSLDIAKTVSFSATEQTFRGSNLSQEEVVADLMLSAKKTLAESISTAALAKLDSYAGVNKFQLAGEVGTWNAVSGDTDIAAANFTVEKMFPYLIETAEMNRYVDPFLLDGRNLFQDYYKAVKNSPNADGKTGVAMYNDFRQYFDLFGFSRAGIANKTFLVDRGSIAVASQAQFSTNPVEYGHKTGQTRYSIPFEQLDVAGKDRVFIDVIYTNECTTSKIKHTWKLIFRGGVFVNPTLGDTDLTGVLSFNKTA